MCSKSRNRLLEGEEAQLRHVLLRVRQAGHRARLRGEGAYLRC